MIIGISNTKEKYNSLTETSKADIVDVLKEETSDTKNQLDEKEIDSIKKELLEEINNSFIPIPKKANEKVLQKLEEEVKDTTKTNPYNDEINLSFGGDSILDKFIDYQKKYPNSKIDVALDSLEYEKNFTNRFLYTRAKAANSFIENSDTREQFLSKILSYASIALFIFLPLFTLFLKLFYVRRKYTYVDHLIFVFHVQTVFFMLFSIYFLLEIFGAIPEPWIFISLFLLYLIIAMKKFYDQGYFKTFIKFLLLNFFYFIIATIGITFVFLISFALF